MKMEKWDLYNAKREKSGITVCRGEIIPKGLYHLSVSAWIVNQQGQYLLSQRHPKKQYPLYWECTGGSVLSGETSLQGAIREVKEELGILLTPGSEKLIYQTRRENVQDFYDVWLFHKNIKIEEMRLQETEVVDVQWVNPDKLFEMFRLKQLHPLITYDFAERFDQEMWKYQFGLGVFSENQLYVRLGTLQDNEGISNALLLRLVGTYAALVLIIICFTILSVQQLTDTIEQKKRFQIISKLGVNKADCGRYIRQQMIFKFGLPVMVSLIFSIGTLLFLTLTGYEEYIVYISLNEMLAIFAVVYAAFIGILISYFVSTYYLFKKHMALS